MVLEHAHLSVDPERKEDFERAFEEARALPAAVPGFRDLQLWRSLEQPGSYRLLIRWDSVADHIVGFRESAGFLRWRELLSPYYVGATNVDHLKMVAEQLAG